MEDNITKAFLRGFLQGHEQGFNCGIKEKESSINEIEMHLAYLESRSRYTDKRITEIAERIEALEKAQEEKIFNELCKPPLKENTDDNETATN